MNNEVVNLLLERGLVCRAQYDDSYDLFFLTTHFLNDAAETELIYDDSGAVISIVAREVPFPNGIDDRSALLRALWTVNKVNEEEIVEAERVGAWILSTGSGNFLYTASCPKFKSLEAIVEFCKAAIQTFFQTRNHFVNIE